MARDDVVGEQAVLVVKMGHQVVVHHGDDLLALFACDGGLFNDPLHRLGLDASAVIIGIGTVATAGERVLLVHVAVDADDDDALDGLAAVAERGGVAHRCLAVAEVPVYLGKLFAGDSRGGHGLVAIIAARVGVVAVVVAGNDQRLDAVLFHPVQMPRHALMAQSLAVMREVSGEQHHGRLHLDDAVGNG